MPLSLLYEDTFAGYSSQLEFEAAYPYDPPGDLSSSLAGSPDSPYVRWGLTRGPGGGPGIENVTATEAPDPSGHGKFGLLIDKVSLNPQCRLFRVSGTWDFAGHIPIEPLNNSNSLFTVWSYETGNRSGSFDGNLVLVGRHHLTGAMPVTVTTTSAYGNSGVGNERYTETIPALLLESGGEYTITIDGRSSILTEASPGVWEPSTDGYIRVYVNASLVFSFDGPVWHGENTTSRNWNSVSLTSVGKFTDFQIYDEICDTVSEPCICEPPPTTHPPLPPIIPKNPPQQPPTIGMQLVCVGGGVVPTQADLVHIESWWGL